MGRPGEVSLLFSFFLLLGNMMHGTRGQYEILYDNYDFEDYDESDYDYGDEAGAEDEYGPHYGVEPAPSDNEEGRPPTAGPQNQEFTPMCNNENCWIRVDWEPPPRDTWMSCLLGYRVGLGQPGIEPWAWMNDEGTHIDLRSDNGSDRLFFDLRSDRLFFFEEAEGTNHSLTIRNIEYDVVNEVVIEVFNPYGVQNWYSEKGRIRSVRTPPGLLLYF